jgi:hypothetical protein
MSRTTRLVGRVGMLTPSSARRARAETALYVRANPLGRAEAVTDPDPEL